MMGEAEADYMRLVRSWAERTRHEVESWRDLSPEGKRERAIARQTPRRPHTNPWRC
jgi:hypothetical protein